MDAAVVMPYNAQFCGGTLIHEKWVVTAAHCLENSDDSINRYDEIDLAIGYNYLPDKYNDPDFDLFTRGNVRRIIKHPLFNSITLDNDIALMELEENSSNEALPVYSGTDSLSGQEAVILGWGKNGGGDYVHYLNEATVSIVSNFECNSAYLYNSEEGGSAITDHMMCAGDSDNWAIDSCDGDSGGPLIITRDGTKELAGITSWGVGCAVEDLYGVYTRASEFSFFLEEAMASATIRGKVTRLNTAGESVAVQGADVSVNNDGVYDKTDSLGRYSVYAAPGTSSITVTYLNYRENTKIIQAVKDEIVTLNIELDQDSSSGSGIGCFISSIKK
jgi:secreted trypsin-like serine protease